MFIANSIRFFTLSALVTSVVGCSSPPVRSVWTDKNMRVFVDPDSVTSQDYVEITNELVKQNKFMVIDRGQGFRAVKNEQERLHRTQNDRFDSKEKWAMWGKLYGVGAIVVGHAQCYRRKPFFNFSGTPYVNTCHQYLSLVDANSGEVIVSVDGKDEKPAPGSNWGSESFTAPQSWSATVVEFVEAYPKEYKAKHYSEGIIRYREQAEQESIKQDEKVLKEQRRYPSTNTPDTRDQDIQYMQKAVQQQNSQEQ